MTAAPLGFFDRIYVINLKSRPDRRAEMAAQLTKIGLSLDSPQVQLFEAVRPQDAGGFPTLGARGCFLSHLGVLRDARDRKLGSVLILEDDLNFSKDFAARFAPVRHHLAHHPWGFFYGSYDFYGERPAFTQAACSPIEPGQAVYTAAFFAVQGQWIAMLVDYLDAMLRRPAGDPAGGPMHVDGAYCWFRAAHPQAQSWIATPALGYQRSSQTDIHPLRWFDRVPPLAAVVAVLRRLRNRLRRG